CAVSKLKMRHYAAILVSAALIFLVSITSALSQAGSSTKPSFEVISIKHANEAVMPKANLPTHILPGGHLSAGGILLRWLMMSAYSLRPYQIIGGPNWIDTDHWVIEARATGTPSLDRTNLMIQSLIENRFKLRAHRETRQLPIYNLVVAKGEAKLASPSNCYMPKPGVPAPPSPLPGERM